MVLLTRRILTLSTVLFFSALCAQIVSAQGLKLGEPANENETLDLGVAPAGSQATEAGAQPARPSGSDVTRTTYRSWEVACLADNTNCAMAQIGTDDAGNPVLEMVIRKLPEPLEAGDEIAIAVLDVITPLGVVLTEGLSLKIDNGDDAIAPFQVCTEQGCLVREPVAEDLIDRLKGGTDAQVTVVAANQGVVTSSLSLLGFTAAFNALR